MNYILYKFIQFILYNFYTIYKILNSYVHHWWNIIIPVWKANHKRNVVDNIK